MTTYTTHIPAGWYPDPLGLPQLRWWDNHTWTDQISGARAPLVHQLVDRQFADPTEVEFETAAQIDAEPASTNIVEPPEATLTSTLRQLEAPLATDAVDSASAGDPTVDYRDSARDDAAFPAATSEWAHVAEAVKIASSSAQPTVLAITSSSFPMLVIDVSERAYWWKAEIAAFPTHPADINIRSHVREEVIMPTGAGFDLSPLLWMTGTTGYADASAPWLTDGARYRLRRWPNITNLPHDADQLRMTSILSHAPLSANELSAIAETTPAAANALLAALSLMNILRVLPGASDEEIGAPAPAAAPRGFFARLRGRHTK
ncbi:DUF2510 domain-containing protein [Salinibacterium sp. M195]|uniref:DUF2510 domain-containing protein n=1 Tax=Salinibacterium sp. M195 TaxID=2583374 RepID=UPI001C6368B1|nr:DUF2510 domain-containing protein [Salinibacterium sp. M195]QYH36669.1 DUF2510 domain-containing protein [Salinibacterium sp. M195]